jgi:hypothetical protein
VTLLKDGTKAIAAEGFADNEALKNWPKLDPQNARG